MAGHELHEGPRMHRMPVMTPSSLQACSRTSSARGVARLHLLLFTATFGVLATVVAVGVHGYRKEGAITRAKVQMDKVAEGISAYAKSHGRYPNDLNELVEMGFIEREELVDPWDTELEYSKGSGGSGSGFGLCSFGPDRRGDTEDAICNGSEHQ